MNKSLIAAVTGVLIGFCIVMAAQAAEHQGPPPEAEAFWEWASKTNPYTEWEYWPGYEGMYPGKSPHGKYLKLYVNDVALKAIQEDQMPLPPGSVIMKANYAKDQETLKALTPMYKVEGYNPEAGDWFWAKYKPGGEALASGKVESCIQCHQAKKDHDWIFSGQGQHQHE